MQKAIVLHSDILGFKEIIEAAESDKNDETLTKLKAIVQQSIGMLRMFDGLNKNIKTTLHHKLFSDNLYASFSYEEGNPTSFGDAFITCIIFARTYFENMLNNGIAVRGGISFGSDYSDEMIIFSYSLVKAYLLESKKAIYPRIVIDNDLIETVKKSLEVPTERVMNILNNSIIKDEEDLYFSNPSGLAKDFDSEQDGLKGEDLDNLFIAQNIKFAEASIGKLNPDDVDEKKVIKKYEWLIDVLTWNAMKRTEQPPTHLFEPLVFGAKK